VSAPMRVRTLGWAGIEVESGGHRIAIDPFADPGPFASFMNGPSTELIAPEAGLDGALLSHLHRDHADPRTLAAALRPGAPLLGPARGEGVGYEGVDRSEEELAAAGLEVTRMAPGQSTALGPFTVTAVDAVDGLGDPQVSWVVATDAARIFHGGDTVWHGAWWRIAKRLGPFDAAFLPANGARVAFPWLEPAADVPAAMTPEQAVEAARALGARELVAIHHGALEHETYYRPAPDVPGALGAAADRRGLRAHAAAAGEEMAW
jgi:L-ascorbate metabolism protein UlaG (beta-lactamase superfamily)